MDKNLYFELEDDYWWQTKVSLPFWKNFQNKNKITVIFAPEGRDIKPLDKKEIALVEWFIDNEATLANTLLNFLLEEYQYNEKEIFDVKSINAFSELIDLQAINIHQITKEEVPYIGFQFTCSWDEEHGLGILMNGNRIVEIGEEDTAFTLWIAERDAKITNENGDIK